MSHRNHKTGRGSKVNYHEYLLHGDELDGKTLFYGALAELDTDLIKNSYYEKRKFRHNARMLRKRIW
jgi:hypothetical protein